MNIPKFKQACALAKQFEKKLDEISAQKRTASKVLREIDSAITFDHWGQRNKLTDILAIPQAEYDRLSAEWGKYMDALRRANALSLRAMDE